MSELIVWAGLAAVSAGLTKLEDYLEEKYHIVDHTADAMARDRMEKIIFVVSKPPESPEEFQKLNDAMTTHMETLREEAFQLVTHVKHCNSPRCDIPHALHKGIHREMRRAKRAHYPKIWRFMAYV